MHFVDGVYLVRQWLYFSRQFDPVLSEWTHLVRACIHRASHGGRRAPSYIHSTDLTEYSFPQLVHSLVEVQHLVPRCIVGVETASGVCLLFALQRMRLTAAVVLEQHHSPSVMHQEQCLGQIRSHFQHVVREVLLDKPAPARIQWIDSIHPKTLRASVTLVLARVSLLPNSNAVCPFCWRLNKTVHCWEKQTNFVLKSKICSVF